MEELAGNRYNFRSDIESLRAQFDSGEYKEDTAVFTKNLFIVLGKITDGQTLTTYIERKVERFKMNTAAYLYLCDVIKTIETDEYVNFSKYSDVIEINGESGKIQKPIVIKVRRNRETEFTRLIIKLDVVGMLSFLDVLSKLERV